MISNPPVRYFSFRFLGFQLLVFSLAALPAVLAQASTAELSGLVLDSSGGRIPGAQVEVLHQPTASLWTTLSDQLGRYKFLALPPGPYQLRVSKEGFNPIQVDGVELLIGQSSSLDLQLSVAGTSQNLEVRASTSILDTQSSALSSVIGQTQIQKLPSNGRSFLDFVLLAPGVSDSTTLVTKRPVQAPTSGLSFSGQDQRSNYLSVDGFDNLDDIGNSARPTLSQDAVAEFQIQSGTFSADTGRARGGVINVISKSGSNQYHGSTFFFLRNEALDARNAFADPAADPRFERYQFGGTLGGPLIKDRTFFFGSYEGLLRNESLFVNFLDDPAIFRLTPSQKELFDFLGSTGIPSLTFLTAAFADPAGGVLNTLPSNFPKTIDLFQRESGTFPFEADTHTYSFKLDHLISEKNQLAVRFGYVDSFNDNTDFGALEGVSNGVNFDVEDLNLTASDRHFFSSRTVNELKFQYGHRDLAVRTNDPVGPEIILAGVAEFGREFFNPTAYKVDLNQFIDHFSWLRGGHDMKAGFDLEFRQRRGRGEVFLGGQFAFGEAIPLGLIFDKLLGPGTADGLAQQLALPQGNGGLGRPDLVANLQAPISTLQSFNFGLPLTYFQGFGDPSTDIPVSRLGFFLQDNWRLHPNLHLNLGIRYDTSWRTQTLNLVDATPPFQFSRFSQNDYDNWAPRIGLAWDISGDDKTVLRAGYGIYYQDLYGALEVTSQVLSGQISQVFLPLTGLPGVPVTSADIWAFIQETGLGGQAALEHFNISPANSPSIILPGDPTAASPYSHQARLSLERELARDWAVSAAYVFNRGLQLIRSHDFNVRQIGPNQFALPGLDPRFVQVPVLETSGRSSYHGLATELRKRFRHGYSLGLSYTLGKAIDDTTDFIIELGPNDQTQLNAEKALSTFDQRHRLVFHAILQLPFGRSSTHAISQLVKNWTVSPILTWGSGKPFNLLTGFDRNGDGHDDTDRPLRSDGTQIGRNTGRGPDYSSLDLRLARTFHWAEEGRLEFTLEAFNLFNRTNYDSLNNVVGNSVLETGVVEGSSNIPANQPLGFTSALPARQIQLGIRLSF